MLKNKTETEDNIKNQKGLISIDKFLANSKKVKQFSSLNEVAFKKIFLELFKKNPNDNPYLKKVEEWEPLFQKLIGIKFKR